MDIASNKFKIIDDIINTPGNVLHLEELCATAGVSRSGYYNWKRSAEKRNQKELQDQQDFEIILEAFKYRGYDKGIRGIYMRLLHMDPPIIMNVKKIQRLMRKYGLLCPIRKANPYRRMSKALKTSNYSNPETDRP